MELTINIEAILAWLAAFGYAALKVISSIWISRKEFQYPIWNQEGEQIERGLPHKVRALIRNFTVNPEWAVMKLVAFLPVALFTGMRYWDRFSPWRIQSCPPLCKQCRDKGKYYTPSFIKGAKGNWIKCNCQVEPKANTHTCMVCLDLHEIGPNRPCPRCAHSGPGFPAYPAQVNFGEEYDNSKGYGPNMRKRYDEKLKKCGHISGMCKPRMCKRCKSMANLKSRGSSSYCPVCYEYVRLHGTGE